MNDYFKNSPLGYENFKRASNGYDFTNGVPKYEMYVRLADDIDQGRRDYIANGIRSFFKSDLTVLLDVAVVKNQISASVHLYRMFVGLIGLISLT